MSTIVLEAPASKSINCSKQPTVQWYMTCRLNELVEVQAAVRRASLSERHAALYAGVTV